MMRLASSSTEALYRPDDQAFKAATFATEAGDYNGFGSFFDEQFCDVDNEGDSKAALGNLGEFMTASSTVNECPLRPSRSESTLPSPSQPQPSWRRALWSLSQKPAPQVSVQKARRQRASPLPDSLRADNDKPAAPWALQSPRASPKPANTKSAPPPRTRRAPMPPSPMYFQLPLHTKMDQDEAWQRQHFDHFDLGVDQEPPREQADSLPAHTQSLPMAVPVPGPVVDAPAVIESEIGLALSKYEDYTSVFGSENSTAAMDPGLIGGQAPTQAFQTSPQLHPSGIQPRGFEPLPTPLWSGNSLDSSSSSRQSYEELRPMVRGSQSVQNMHDMYKKHENMWPSPSQAAAAAVLIRRGRLPTRVHTHHASEGAPMQIHHSPEDMVVCQNVEQNVNAMYLAEQMNHAPFHEPETPLHHSRSTGALPYSPHVHGPMPAMPMPPTHMTSAGGPAPSPFVTPRQTRVMGGSRSPSPTTLFATPRTAKQRSPARGASEHSLRRRKSIQKLGPIRDLHEPPPPLPHSSARTHSRSRSMSKMPKTPKTPTGAGSVSLDFVNFTPKDSIKLLSDVAPSGSSKTRARREAEAREKRRKLSEAALKAVSSAGGDVEALKKVILA